ncbi:MAG TPA: TetR family transcriptional regulator [Gaiellaceae bacterium]|nr:TetR family transcriptional regulator [Gaiellaceae bacterium]
MATTPAQSDRVATILDAACRVVVREGAHGLRMASVATEAGVSKALVHYYFSTRQELLRSAFAHAENRLNDAVEADLATLSTGAEKVERALLASVDADSPFGEQRALWNEVWSSLSFDDELRPHVESYYRAFLGRVEALVVQGLEDGSVPVGIDARTAAWRLCAIADGVDSMLYLGLLDGEGARELVAGGVRRELGSA